MSYELQQCHLNSYLDVVVLPAQKRLTWLRSRKFDGCWTRWAEAEMTESFHLLMVGEALSLFPRDSFNQVSNWAKSTIGEVPSALPFEPLSGNLVPVKVLGRMRDAGPAVSPSSPAHQRAMARSIGLFRSAYLLAGTLGHGAGAEALTQLAHGRSASCRESILEQAALDSVPDASRYAAINALANPGLLLKFPLRRDGSVLAASVVHGVEFMYSVAYAQQERDVTVLGEAMEADVLQTHVGVPTGDLLHSILYWRLPAKDATFRQDFLEAVGAAGVLLFKLGALEHEGTEAGSAIQFGTRLRERVTVALDAWGRNIHAEEEWGGEGASKGTQAQDKEEGSGPVMGESSAGA